MNSLAFDYLVGFFAGKVGGVQYEVGLIGKVPVPDLSGSQGAQLGKFALACVNLKRELDEHQREIDNIAFQLYGIDGEDRKMMEAGAGEPEASATGASETEDEP